MEKTIQSAKIVSGLIISGIILLSVFINGYSTEKKDVANEEVKAGTHSGIPVDGQVLHSATLADEMTVSGTLVAYQSVGIASELSRKIVSVFAAEGKHVNAGALLFKLDDADLRAELVQLEQQEKLLVLNERRLKDLIDNEAAIRQDYDEAFTNLKVLQAKIDQLKVMIDKTSIRAPFSGVLGIVNVHPGAFVNPGTTLATLTDNNRLKVDFAVPEKHAVTLKTGDEVTFQVESDSKVRKAKVLAHDAVLDPKTRTLLMRAVAVNDGLLPGQSARLTLRLGNTGTAILVPNQALLPTSKGYNVYVLNNHKAQIKAVEVGVRKASQVHITRGLSNGDTLITSNMLRLNPGSEVELVSVH